MTNKHDFAVLSIRQVALDDEAKAVQFVEELAVGFRLAEGWERTEITNMGSEGTNEAIRFSGESQSALVAAVDASPNSERIRHYFVVPTS